MVRSTAVGVLLLSALLLAAPPARAWTDARPSGLVTELAVDRDGGATVTLRIRWRVLAGRFRAFDLVELPADFALLEATAADASGNVVPVATRVASAGRLELTLGEAGGGGLRRGALDVVVRYTTSLRAQGAIHRAGDDAVLEIATVPWERGLEATEIRVALPASVRRAQWLSDETPGVDTTVTSELGRDVVHAVRRHLPAGARWTARVACDPALFTWLGRPEAALPSARRIDRHALLPVLGLGAALALVLGVAAAALRRRSRSVPALVRLPRSLGALAVALPALGGALQSLALLDVPGVATAGTLLALAGFALGVPGLVAPAAAPASAPAGLWAESRMREAAREGGAGLQRGVVLVALAAATALAVVAVSRRSAGLGIAALDLALVALAAAVMLRRLAPRPDALLLRPAAAALARRLSRSDAVRLVWRVRGDGRAPGSVSVRVLPRGGRRFKRGVRAIDLVPVWRAGALAWRGSVALVVRADRGADLEPALRAAADRVGRVVAAPDGERVAYVAELAGPGTAALRELARMLPAALEPAVTGELARGRADKPVAAGDAAA